MNPNAIRQSALALSSVVATALQAVAAQNAPSVSQEALETITVTATRREESVQSVPISITALSADALANAGVRETRDLVGLAPNLAQQGSFGHTSPSFFLRGIGSTQFNPNANSKVGIYLDDVYLASPAVHGSQIFDVASVEIARGPQGTLFGQNTTAGLVRLITARPDVGAGFTADLSLTAGRYGQLDPEVAIGFDTGDSSAARISVLRQIRDGYQRNTLLGSDDGEIDALGWRAQWQWQAAGVDLLMRVHGSRDKGQVAPYKQVGLIDPETSVPCPRPRLGSGCTDFFGYADAPDFHEGQWDVRDQYTDVESFGANVTVDWKLPAFTLTSVTAYEQNESRIHEDPDASPNYVMTGNYHGEPRQTSQEIRLTSPAGDLSWIAGAYYFQETMDTSVGFPIPGFGPGALSGLTDVLEGLGQISTMDTDSYAVFGNVDLAATDRLKLTLGLRYTHETKDVDYAAWLSDVTDVGSMTFFTDREITSRAIAQTIAFRKKKSWDDVSGRASLGYSFSEDVLGYATVSRGFNSGNYNGGALSDQAEAALVDPETLLSYEIGLKSELADHRLRLNLSAFYYDFTDQQVFVLAAGDSGVPVQQLSNAAASTLYGLELETVWRPLERLQVQVGAGYTHSEFDEFRTPLGEDLSGRTLPSAPEINVNAMVIYTLPTTIGALAFEADAKYQSTQYFSVNNDPILSQGPYTIANTHVSWTSPGGHTAVTAWVRNLANEDYRAGAYDLASFGWDQWIVGEPRTYGVTLAYHLH